MAIVGLGFGAELIPIYQHHPFSEMYAICQRNTDKLNQIGNHFGIRVRYSSFEEMLQDDQIDAVYINSPIPNHAEQSIYIHPILAPDGNCVSLVLIGGNGYELKRRGTYAQCHYRSSSFRKNLALDG